MTETHQTPEQVPPLTGAITVQPGMGTFSVQTASHPVTIHTQAAGKLFIAGEYAVIESGNPAILVAVNRYVRATLQKTESQGSIHSEQYGNRPVHWFRRNGRVFVELDDRPFDYVLATIETVEELVVSRGQRLKFFDLHISSELDDTSGRKFGLGSSAAVTAATTKALDQFYGLNLDDEMILKLCLLATVKINPMASGGDLAASVLGGWVLYTSPDREWLQTELERIGIAELLESDWPGFSAKHIKAPDTIQLIVGWTGEPASTMRLVDRLQHNPALKKEVYQKFLVDSRQNTLAMAEAIAADNTQDMFRTIREARRLLNHLSTVSGITIETEALTELCNAAESIGAAAKSSGAGGGDCGIVLAQSNADVSQLLRDWELNDIRRLSLDIHD